MTKNNEIDNQIIEVYVPKGNPLSNEKIPDGTTILGEPENIEKQPLPNESKQDENILQEGNNGV